MRGEGGMRWGGNDVGVEEYGRNDVEGEKYGRNEVGVRKREGRGRFRGEGEIERGRVGDKGPKVACVSIEHRIPRLRQLPPRAVVFDVHRAELPHV